ncbi:S-adenosylmethionine:tRNA ribosyltransferase-isomerase [Rufibacter quisquiliarum]|uniref:S-adenosylmethionine:tRNA ribosyltransferase-isomerase n=1 Tax=Rufibacter quisquiliarum TaxID=1549639 RepID=A0A839GPH7_9BACT|nr:S-adenosylmethionine:tRNA ribosyltransferase-isomerase [Rufibacter quisquiliarum]MBA9075751.1 S-adenosylmethionine:tRNA ribosyltransferase-isomerase [Rufibacter quisquiliarum]
MSNQHPRQLSITDFTYDLPEDRIAQFPLEVRDQSRLLLCRQGKISDGQFKDLATVLPPQAMLVFNDTKVVQARLRFQKATGGMIELFCLEPLEPVREVQVAMQQTYSVVWKCLVGNNKRWKDSRLEMPLGPYPQDGTLWAERLAPAEEGYAIHFTWSPGELTFAEILEKAGLLPLPPYMNRDAEVSDQDRYQTVYAAEKGAVAAPTAGLHFTPELLERIQQQGHQQAFVTLHVGAGTFKPVKADLMQYHYMHGEQLNVSRQMIEKLLHHLGKPIIPVGTTSMRTLESLYWLGAGISLGLLPPEDEEELVLPQWFPYDVRTTLSVQEALEALLHYLDENQLPYLQATTRILIAPGYSFKLCTGLITNFHQPQSTLLLLVAALIGPTWQKVYKHALANGYRFLSYGDSSLLLP